MPNDPTLDPPAAPGGYRPSFANVVTTGNLVAIVTTVVAALPVIALIYGAGALVTTIQGKLDVMTGNVALVNAAEITDRTALATLRTRLQDTEIKLEAELSVVRERLAAIDARNSRKDAP